MKSASTTLDTQLPETPPNEVTGGLDWSRDNHAVAVVDARGREIVRHTVEHTAAGLRELIAVLAEAGCGEVAIERPDGPVVDALLAAGLTVVVISPNQVKNLRGRYGSAGNKDDRFDAYVLADTLRTDRPRLRALVPDSDPTVALRRAVPARRDGTTQATVTAALVAVLNTLLNQINTVADSIQTQLSAHADAHIFTNLPRAGRIRAARLLAEIGDCRARFPTPESLTCLAGVAPSTRQSGKVRAVGFRWACNKQLRDAACDFAGDSRRANPWAEHLYRQARTRGHDHPHAVRILARAWLTVIWHCWHDHVAYNPAQHRALQQPIQDQQAAA